VARESVAVSTPTPPSTLERAVFPHSRLCSLDGGPCDEAMRRHEAVHEFITRGEQYP
jgi:hypothetical protein